MTTAQPSSGVAGQLLVPEPRSIDAVGVPHYGQGLVAKVGHRERCDRCTLVTTADGLPSRLAYP